MPGNTTAVVPKCFNTVVECEMCNLGVGAEGEGDWCVDAKTGSQWTPGQHAQEDRGDGCNGDGVELGVGLHPAAPSRVSASS